MEKVLTVIFLSSSVILVACASEPVEVTRIVTSETEVEVTRLVETEIEVEVTRLVEVPVEVTRIVQELVIVTPTPPPLTPAPVPTEADHEQEISQLDLVSFADTWALIGIEDNVSFIYDFREDHSYILNFSVTNEIDGEIDEFTVTEAGTWEVQEGNTVCLITQDREIPQCNQWVVDGALSPTT